MIQFLLNRWVVLVLGFVIMFVGLMPDLTMRAVRMFGKMGWAEERVGRGGTFTIWKIIGILAPIAAIIYFFSGGVHLDNQTQNQNKIQQEQGDYNI